VFLDLNGVDPTAATNDDVVELIVEVATSPIDVRDLAARLRDVVRAERR
jgi:hypothetical protein